MYSLLAPNTLQPKNTFSYRGVGWYGTDETKVYVKDYYDKEMLMYHYDYWCEPKNTEKTKLEWDVKHSKKLVVDETKKWCEVFVVQWLRQSLAEHAYDCKI